MAIIGWKAWFVDVPHGAEIRRFSSDGNFLAQLPVDGCLGVVSFFSDKKPDGNPTRQNFAGLDYYFFVATRNGLIVGADVETREKNLPKELYERYKNPVVCRGIWTDDDTMKQVTKEMREAITP